MVLRGAGTRSVLQQGAFDPPRQRLISDGSAEGRIDKASNVQRVYASECFTGALLGVPGRRARLHNPRKP